MWPIEIPHIEGKQTSIALIQFIDQTPHVIVIETELIGAKELEDVTELVYLAVDLDHSAGREENDKFLPKIYCIISRFYLGFLPISTITRSINMAGSVWYRKQSM